MKKLLFILLLPLSLFAQLPKEISPSSHVNDYVDVLSHDQTGSLAEKIFFIERTYNVSIRILLIKSLDGNSIEDFAKTVGNAWRVGESDQSAGSSGKGIVYVASLEDRKQRLDLSAGMQKRITDDQAAEMTDAVTAHFKSGHYYEGLYALLSAMQAVLEINKFLPPQTSNNYMWYTVGSVAGICILIYLLTMYIRKKRCEEAITNYYNPEATTNSDHTPYPHRLMQQANGRIPRKDFSSEKIVEHRTQFDNQPDNTLTNLIIMEEIIDSNNNNNIPSYDPGPSPDNSSSDYGSSDNSSSSSSDYSSSSSSDNSSSSYDSGSSSSYDSGSSSSFDGGGGSSSDF